MSSPSIIILFKNQTVEDLSKEKEKEEEEEEKDSHGIHFHSGRAFRKCCRVGGRASGSSRSRNLKGGFRFKMEMEIGGARASAKINDARA